MVKKVEKSPMMLRLPGNMPHFIKAAAVRVRILLRGLGGNAGLAAGRLPLQSLPTNTLSGAALGSSYLKAAGKSQTRSETRACRAVVFL